MPRTSWSGAWASSIRWGNTASLQAQYVGTRAVNQPYLTQVNGYQTVCPGCASRQKISLWPANPRPPRFGAVTQFSTGANSHYDGLQLTAMKRDEPRLPRDRSNHTWSHCLDTVSNGGFLQFSAGGILSPLPGELRATHGQLRLRHPPQPHRAVHLPVAIQGARSANRHTS